jgi:RNA polymerase sigma-70 factor (ECF subfamily)
MAGQVYQRGLQYLERVGTTSPQSGDLTLPLPSAPQSRDSAGRDLPERLLQELCVAARAAAGGLTCDEFSAALYSVGEKFNYGLPAGAHPDHSRKADFLRSLRLEDLALATACALGRELAWQRFVHLYSTPLTHAAIAITGSGTLGHDLADSLYPELYGLREVEGQRRSPLASYSGRGSLLGWLRTTLAQRHVDHHRRTHRESPLDALDAPAPQPDPIPVAAELTSLTRAITITLESVSAEERYLLCSYFLDRQPLAQIGRVLHVHEATISRRLKHLLTDLRKRLLHHLQAGGLSKRAAEEALGNDPRDLEINLHALLQSSQIASFSEQKAAAPSGQL